MAMVYSFSTSELTVSAALLLLSNVDDSKISVEISKKALGGQLFLYGYQNCETKDDWVADGYRWINNGTDRLPNKDPVIYKRKFKAWNPEGGNLAFKRVAFTHINDPKYILVQYIGDSSSCVDAAHGNQKKPAAHFRRTAPSVITRVAEKAKTGRNPMGIYQEEIASGLLFCFFIFPNRLTLICSLVVLDSRSRSRAGLIQ